jgi:hypothetical protein
MILDPVLQALSASRMGPENFLSASSPLHTPRRELTLREFLSVLDNTVPSPRVGRDQFPRVAAHQKYMPPRILHHEVIFLSLYVKATYCNCYPWPYSSRCLFLLDPSWKTSRELYCKPLVSGTSQPCIRLSISSRRHLFNVEFSSSSLLPLWVFLL